MDATALKEREGQIVVKGEAPFAIVCNKDSLAGAVSQRACVFCGSRVVLYPIADALHLSGYAQSDRATFHGPQHAPRGVAVQCQDPGARPIC